MPRIGITLALLLLGINLFAGRYAGDFMAIGAGVRPLGMAGAFAGVADNCDAIYWNAAGLAQLHRPEVGLMHAFLYQDLASYDNLSYAQPLPNQVTIGLNWTRLTISDIPNFEEKYLVGTNVDQRSAYPDLQLPGVTEKYFRSTDDLYQFAFSKNFHRDVNMGWFFFEVPFDFYIGGNIKYIKREVQDYLGTGTGFDFSLLAKTDLAVILDTDWMGTLQAGLSFKDLGGTSITWNTESDHMDEIMQTTKLGLAVIQPIPNWHSVLVMAFDTDYEYDTVQRYGIEWRYRERSALRLGYYDRNLTAGVGFRFYSFEADYGFSTNVLGYTNRIGLSFTY
jgi:hypothetical protein